MSAPAGAEPSGFLWAAGPVAEMQRAHFFQIVGWMAVVVVPLFLALPVILWRYRAGAGDTYRPEWQFNRLAEWAIWGIPILVVAVLGVTLWRYTHALDPYAPLGPDPLEVQLVLTQDDFVFLYPGQDVALVDRLLIPAGRGLRLRMTSDSVMQSVIIPRLGGQVYAMAGMVTELNLQADAPGLYQGRNTQYSGRGFPGHVFTAEAVAPDSFDARLAELTEGAPALDPGAYDRLLSFGDHGPRAYAGLAPDFFERVVEKYAGPLHAMEKASE
ncbi:cytochrome ubiquinol oxidase subunit II [Aquicoccus sp. SCR17]|nr:cytochrome ubiquinol oxidase subunit II [Carideicomes alvinocaridis]